MNSPRGLAIDEINQKLYWVELNALKRADLDGSNVETILDDTELLGTVLGGALGLDVEDDRIFVGYGCCSIGVTDLAGSFFNSFFTSGADGIEVDVVANKVYFAQTQDIDRINYDGSNRESVIFASFLGFDAKDCDIDFANGKIYMADSQPTQFGIWRANLDETEVEPISSAFIEKADIDVVGGKIYWTDDIDGQVVRANLDGTSVETLHTGLTNPQGIVVLPGEAAGCTAVADCADVDEDGIRDDGCTWWACESGVCLGTDIAYADMGGANGACVVDGTADANDRFHALNCFSNQTTTGTVGYPCEDEPPAAFNVDVAGLGTPCIPDGVCDSNDAFAAINAFSGNTSCSCSGPAPAEPWEPPDSNITETADLSVHAERAAVRSGQLVHVEVRLDTPLKDLRGYQLHLAASGGRRGQLELVDIAFPEAHVWQEEPVASPWSAFNHDTAQMVAGLDTPGMPVDPGVLAVFTYHASRDAYGTFTIALQADRSDPHQRSVLFPTQADGLIEMRVSEPVQINIR